LLDASIDLYFPICNFTSEIYRYLTALDEILETPLKIHKEKSVNFHSPKVIATKISQSAPFLSPRVQGARSSTYTGDGLQGCTCICDVEARTNFDFKASTLPALQTTFANMPASNIKRIPSENIANSSPR